MNFFTFEKLVPHAKEPTKAKKGDLGFDLFSSEQISIEPGETVLVSTGIRVAFPIGWGAKVFDRSSVATKMKLFVVAGVIDEGYRGPIKVALYNSGVNRQVLPSGEKIAQLVPMQTTDDWVIVEGKVNTDTERGQDGFGSTGR